MFPSLVIPFSDLTLLVGQQELTGIWPVISKDSVLGQVEENAWGATV